jgi:predicted Rdx family selenoprotein
LQRAGHEAGIHEGAKSQFDVVSDGTLVFSKQREGRFPEEDEVVELLSPVTGHAE